MNEDLVRQLEQNKEAFVQEAGGQRNRNNWKRVIEKGSNEVTEKQVNYAKKLLREARRRQLTDWDGELPTDRRDMSRFIDRLKTLIEG